MKERKKKSFYKQVGIRLRLLREKRGYTLPQICEVLYKKTSVRFDHNLLGKIERGESKIQLDIFFYLCEIYAVELSYFRDSHNPEGVQKKFLDEILENAEGRNVLQLIQEKFKDRMRLQILERIIYDLIKFEDHSAKPQQSKQSTILKAASSRKKN